MAREDSLRFQHGEMPHLRKPKNYTLKIVLLMFVKETTGSIDEEKRTTLTQLRQEECIGEMIHTSNMCMTTAYRDTNLPLPATSRLRIKSNAQLKWETTADKCEGKIFPNIFTLVLFELRACLDDFFPGKSSWDTQKIHSGQSYTRHCFSCSLVLF